MTEPTARQLSQQRSALAKAAKSLFDAARIAVEEIDEHCWRVGAPGAPFLFWPESGFWRHPGGKAGGGGPSGLARAIRATPASSASA
jgi:hypothetical protein